MKARKKKNADRREVLRCQVQFAVRFQDGGYARNYLVKLNSDKYWEMTSP